MPKRKRRLKPDNSYQGRLTRLAMKERNATKLLTDSELAADDAYMAARKRYSYVSGGTNAKGQEVWFCWSTKKDKNGLWWSWREVHTKTAIHRYNVSTRTKKSSAKALAYRRQNAWVDKP
ncbi:MAG TPA: hypothetical protein VF077_10305 [Nitrospiraceae bacterium]